MLTDTPISLLERIRLGGDSASWERLVALYTPLIRGWLGGYGLQPTDVDDLTQEVLRAAVTALPQFRRDRPGDSFRGWLWTITRNKVRDHWRRHADQAKAAGGTTAQEVMRQVPDDTAPNSEAGAEEESSNLYHRALELIRSEFEERTWRAFLMVTVEGRLPADAAAELGTTPGAVYIAKCRVIKRLREEFGDLLEDRGVSHGACRLPR